MFKKLMHAFGLMGFSLALLSLNVAMVFAQSSDALDRALDARWNTQDVPAVEGDIRFVTDHTVEIALSLGYQPNDDYANIVPIMLDVVYHIDASWSVGLRGSVLAAHADTELKRFLTKHQPTLDVEMLYEDQLGDLTVMAAYHPLYGKWTAGTTNLGAFDWGVFVGMGAVFVDAPNEALTKREKTAHFEGLLGMDAHVFFLDWLALRIEASIRLYQGTNRFMAPCFLGVGVSFFIPTGSSAEVE